MMDSNDRPALDVRAMGRHMSRERYQRGSLAKVGKTRKKWRGRWHIYEKQSDGSEKLCKREKILGPVSELTKAQAQDRLDALIRLTNQTSSGSFATDATFGDLWIRYTALKVGTWGDATGRAIKSLFAHQVLPSLGERPVRGLTRDPLQACLNRMAAAGSSYSAVHKARTYIAATLEYAVDERVIEANPARKIEVPTQILGEICERYYSVEEVRRLSGVAHGRERIVLRIFIDCGLRPQELFALRRNDVEPLRLRIDEALKETERGDKRIGSRTKTHGSKGFVAISKELEQEIRGWIEYQALGADDFIFSSSTGTPFQIRNYLRRVLKPLALRAGIADMTYQALRRTCATHFNRHGSPRDTQAQMRHTSMRMTNWYIKEVPAEVRDAVERMDSELWSVAPGPVH